LLLSCCARGAGTEETIAVPSAKANSPRWLVHGQAPNLLSKFPRQIREVEAELNLEGAAGGPYINTSGSNGWYN
jgi:hypothetical protein